MRGHLIRLRKSLNKAWKEGFILLLLSFGFFVACQGALEDGLPFGPSTNILRILPTTATVITNTEQTFTTIGGTAPFTWTSSNLNVGTIIAATGVFTGGEIPGTATITVVDAVGNISTATATVPGLNLTFDVNGATEVAASTVTVITVTANGSGVGLTTTISNNNTGSLYALVPTIVTTGNTITITSPATLPTGTEGDQTFTISVTDVQNTNTGTLTYLLQNDGT